MQCGNNGKRANREREMRFYRHLKKNNQIEKQKSHLQQKMQIKDLKIRRKIWEMENKVKFSHLF